MVNEAIPVNATMMIRIGLTMLASTAACPRTKAPTIPIVCPSGVGTRTPASRISSREISIMRISKKIGKGTDSREPMMTSNNSVGINST